MELDNYYKSMYDGGTITLGIGEETTFVSNASDPVKSKSYTIKLISIDGDSAKLQINGDNQLLQRPFDYSYDLIRFKGIGFSKDKVVIAIGSAF